MITVLHVNTDLQTSRLLSFKRNKRTTNFHTSLWFANKQTGTLIKKRDKSVSTNNGNSKMYNKCNIVVYHVVINVCYKYLNYLLDDKLLPCIS